MQISVDGSLPAYRLMLPIFAVLAVIAALSGRAIAAEPGIYRVVGVAAGDTLNIRSEPNADTEILGEYSPDARRIEVLQIVISDAAEWGRVLVADGNGWVAMRFLEPDDAPSIPGTGVPVELQCSGTEPFWDLKAGADALEFGAIDLDPISLPIKSAVTAIGRNNRFSFVASHAGQRMTAMLASGETCSDGMSDRDFGWRIDLLIEGVPESPRQYEGCCRLPPVN